MKQEYYSDIVKLIQYPEWKTYKLLLEDERQSIFNAFENGAAQADTLRELRYRMDEIRKVIRLPYDLVKEHEEKLKDQRRT